MVRGIRGFPLPTLRIWWVWDRRLSRLPTQLSRNQPAILISLPCSPHHPGNLFASLLAILYVSTLVLITKNEREQRKWVKSYDSRGHKAILQKRAPLHRFQTAGVCCKLQVASCKLQLLQLEAALTVSPPAVPVPTGNGYSGDSISTNHIP